MRLRDLALVSLLVLLQSCARDLSRVDAELCRRLGEVADNSRCLVDTDGCLSVSCNARSGLTCASTPALVHPDELAAIADACDQVEGECGPSVLETYWCGGGAEIHAEAYCSEGCVW